MYNRNFTNRRKHCTKVGDNNFMEHQQYTHLLSITRKKNTEISFKQKRKKLQRFHLKRKTTAEISFKQKKIREISFNRQ
jgi:hypothetical protein